MNIRDYWLVILLLLVLMTTIGINYSKLLTGLTERTVAQVNNSRFRSH